jgi:hypothetical protein
MGINDLKIIIYIGKEMETGKRRRNRFLVKERKWKIKKEKKLEYLCTHIPWR